MPGLHRYPPRRIAQLRAHGRRPQAAPAMVELVVPRGLYLSLGGVGTASFHRHSFENAGYARIDGSVLHVLEAACLEQEAQ